MSLLFYFDHAVKGFHVILDLSVIITAFIDEVADIQKSSYSEMYKSSDDDIDDDKVEIPVLKNSTDLVDFRDKCVLQLSLTKSKRVFPLDYLLDNTDRAVTSIRSPLTETDLLDLSIENLYKTSATYFGLNYKIDNKALWTKIKTLLVGTSNYNHISSYDAKNNGRKAWKALIAVFEGQDFVERQR